MEKVLISKEGNYVLLRNVAEIRMATGDKPHFIEARLIGEKDFIPIEGKMTDLIANHLEFID
ncbi:MAG: hypothetical protein ACO1N0_02780 [Fluviicola sp.]